MTTPQPFCTGCNRMPEDIPEYQDPTLYGYPEDTTPTEYVLAEEGTLNGDNGHFLCTGCYIKAGMPTSPQGWVAP